jgi:Zn-finger nucleic acid-binding protein
MNFIMECATTGTKVELKYCERCGGLFLRMPKTSIAYCTKCQARWVKLADSGNVQSRRTRSNAKNARSQRARARKWRPTPVEELHGCGAIEVLR